MFNPATINVKTYIKGKRDPKTITIEDPVGCRITLEDVNQTIIDMNFDWAVYDREYSLADFLAILALNLAKRKGIKIRVEGQEVEP